MNKKPTEKLSGTSDRNWNPSKGDYVSTNSKIDTDLLKSRIRKESLLKFWLIVSLVTILISTMYYFSSV